MTSRGKKEGKAGETIIGFYLFPIFSITTGHHHWDTLSLEATGYMKTFFLFSISTVDNADL